MRMVNSLIGASNDTIQPQHNRHRINPNVPLNGGSIFVREIDSVKVQPTPTPRKAWYEEDNRTQAQKARDVDQSNIDLKSRWGVIETLTGGDNPLIVDTGVNVTEKGQVYKAETESRRNRLVAHYYLVTQNGKFIEVNNDGTPKSGAVEMLPSELKSKVEQAREDIESVNEQINEGQTILSGEDFYHELVYNTSASDGEFVYDGINNTLEHLNQYNILDFIDSYYDAYLNDPDSNRSGREKSRVEAGLRMHEGLMERIDDECDRSYIKMENKLNMIKAFLDLCESDEYYESLKRDRAYFRLREIYDSYANPTRPQTDSSEKIKPRWYRDMSENQTFNHTTHRPGSVVSWWSHTIGRAFGQFSYDYHRDRSSSYNVDLDWMKYTDEDVVKHKYRFYDNEIIDSSMRILEQKIKALDAAVQ